jgi:hypothetical protein
MLIVLIGILELPFLCTCMDVCKRVSPAALCIPARPSARRGLAPFAELLSTSCSFLLVLAAQSQTAMKMEMFENLMLRGGLYFV